MTLPLFDDVPAGGNTDCAAGRHGPLVDGEPIDPSLDALAGYAHRCGYVGLGPAGLMTGNDQSTTVNGQAGATVGHENLRVSVGRRQAHPIRRFSFVQPGSPLPTSWPGTPRGGQSSRCGLFRAFGFAKG